MFSLQWLCPSVECPKHTCTHTHIRMKNQQLTEKKRWKGREGEAARTRQSFFHQFFFFSFFYFLPPPHSVLSSVYFIWLVPSPSLSLFRLQLVGWGCRFSSSIIGLSPFPIPFHHIFLVPFFPYLFVCLFFFFGLCFCNLLFVPPPSPRSCAQLAQKAKTNAKTNATAADEDDDDFMKIERWGKREKLYKIFRIL